ncbi:MAG: hypothetical protein H6815_11945 [Phycisphaeraceae bacterium]|nr:hypothetical protein [Phycisphaerales bacterium]MCB9861152.1 hypothetical protein [Phycisphaeraceae bacterium]
MKRTGIFAAGLTACLVGLTACASYNNAELVEKDPAVQVAPASAESINERCTFTGVPVRDKYNLSYKGETIGFCSEDSQHKFLVMDEEGRDKVAAKARAQRE